MGGVRVVVVLAVAAGLLAGLGAWLARLEGHWSIDCAVWELMTREVARRGWQGLWVDNLARQADPQGRFFPALFFIRRQDRFYFIFQPTFGLLSAPAYQLLGRPGLLLLPLTSALVIGLLVAVGSQRFALTPGWMGSVAALFLTPLPLYAVTVWNHLPSVALLTLGALLVGVFGLQGPFRPAGMVLAGLPVGLALLFRNEAYVYAAALTFAWIVAAPQNRWKGAGLFLLGFLAGWCVQAALHWAVFGSFFGPKAEGVAAAQLRRAPDLGYRLWNLYLFFVAPDFSAFLRGGVERGLLLFTPLLITTVLLVSPTGAQHPRLMTLAMWLVVAATTVVLAGRTQVTGFFWVAPYLILAFIRRILTPVRKFLLILSVTFAGSIVWVAWHGGFQWGPRYLLALYPLMVWLALDGWSAAPSRLREAIRPPVAALLVLALLAQAAGLDHVDQQAWQATQALRTIRGLPTRYVVVGLEIFAWDFAPAYGEKILLSVDSREELEEAVRGLARARVAHFTYVPRSGPGFDRRVIEQVAVGRVRYRVTRDQARGDLRWIQYELETF